MTTNLQEIKNTTKAIARAVRVTNTNGLPIAIHPFIDSVIWYDKVKPSEIATVQNDIDSFDLTNQSVFDEWCKWFNRRVDECKNATRVYMLWRDPWKLTFMKYCGEHLNKRAYAEFLADAWVTEENPNMDVNMSLEEAIQCFKKAEKRHLMTEEDYLYYNNLPSEIEVFRGVSKGRVELGLSWTDNREKAIWFMERFKGKKMGEQKLLKATIRKDDVLAYFNTRNEQEIVVDVFAIQDKIERII